MNFDKSGIGRTAVAVSIALAIGVVSFSGYYASLPAAPNEEELAGIIKRQDACRRALWGMTHLGAVRETVLKDSGELLVSVEDAVWDRLSEKQQLANAMTAYCAYTPPNGNLTVTVQNLAGKDILQVINGHGEATRHASKGFRGGQAGH